MLNIDLLYQYSPAEMVEKLSDLTDAELVEIMVSLRDWQESLYDVAKDRVKPN